MRTIPGIALGALALALSLALGGCGDKTVGEKAATQVVAKVNDDEITVHQLNLELAGLQGVSPEQAKQASGQVLKSMVDQQLLVQQALQDKLDRDPQFQQLLEAMRRKLLAQAYAEKLTANTAAPTEAEVDAYYDKHPELFAERRIYRLQEISVQVNPGNVEAVKAQLAQSKNLNDFIQWLKAQNIPARATQTTKAAEQLPLEILPRLHALKNGQALTLNVPGALNILVVADSQTQPMAKEDARPVIERFLLNNKKREAAEAALKALRDKARIEYLGDYASLDKQRAETAPAAPVEQAAPAAQNPAPDAQAIEKGISGLK
jgi:EpsD family peptidyl-prolyl cis-trans isomerase